MNEPTPETLLDQVCDRESFVAFVHALADQRSRAEEIEKKNPTGYYVDGALGWMNGDIQNFLGACVYNLEELRPEEPEPVPSWRLFAEILWCGKIIE